jgi:uncharacterized protein (DUF305 family)
MFATKYRAVGVTALALAAALTLAGCTNAMAGMDVGGSSTMGGSGSTNSSTNAAGFSAADIMFAQMMIPHHKQAVAMSTLAETRTTTPAVLALAKQIKGAQAPEITQMTGWLTASGSSLDAGHSMGTGMSMGGGMDGMMTDADMSALEGATGTAFDTLFLRGMIGHHEGAVQMAQAVIDSNNAEVKALAGSVVASQTAEVAEMKAMLGQ